MKRLLLMVTMALGAALPALGYSDAPPFPKVEGLIHYGHRITLFSQIFKASGVTVANLNSGYVTFLAPRDSTCSAEEKAALTKIIQDKDAARSYILDHAVKGQLIAGISWGRPDIATYIPIPTNSISDSARVHSVVIDARNPSYLNSLGGKKVKLAMVNNNIYMSNNAVLENRVNGGINGGVLELDHCAVLSN